MKKVLMQSTLLCESTDKRACKISIKWIVLKNEIGYMKTKGTEIDFQEDCEIIDVHNLLRLSVCKKKNIADLKLNNGRFRRWLWS